MPEHPRDYIEPATTKDEKAGRVVVREDHAYTLAEIREHFTLTPKDAPKRYSILIVYEDIEAAVIGPFDTEEERDAKARELKAEHGDEHGLHWIDHEGLVTVGDWSGGFFEDDDLDDETEPATPIEESPSYRDAMTDAGRGHLLR